MSEQPEELAESGGNERLAWSDRHKGAAVVLVALVAGKSRKDAAELAGVGVSTIRRWEAEEEGFRLELREMREALLEQAFGKVLGLVDEALEALHGLLADANSATRLGAIKEVLASALRLRSEVDLHQRLARIEALVEGLGVAAPRE